MEELVCAGSCPSLVAVARGLVGAFLAVLFVQSGVDKVVDRAGNLAWLTGHFAKSPLAGTVPLLLTTVTVLELAAGSASGVGVILGLAGLGWLVATVGVVLAAVALLCLFTGQRLAKDYAGAAALVPYFLLTVVGLLLLDR